MEVRFANIVIKKLERNLTFNHFKVLIDEALMKCDRRRNNMTISELRMVVNHQNQIFQDVENITQDGIPINHDYIPRLETHIYEFDFMRMTVDGPETGIRKKVHWKYEGEIYRVLPINSPLISQPCASPSIQYALKILSQL